MALVILGMAAAGVLLPFSSGAAVQAEGVHRTLAAKLAGDLMEQIVATPLEDTKSAWDHVYDDEFLQWVWKRVEPQGQVKDASGTVFTDSIYARFSRDAVFYEVWVPQQGSQGWLAEPNFIRVSVCVYYQGRPIVTLSRLISE